MDLDDDHWPDATITNITGASIIDEATGHSIDVGFAEDFAAPWGTLHLRWSSSGLIVIDTGDTDETP